MRLTRIRAGLVGGALLAIATSTLAANDSDSIGRSVKYLDFSNRSLAVFAKGTCPAPAPPQNIPVRCYLLSGSDNEFGSLNDVVQIDVAAASSRSLLGMSMMPTVLLSLSNATTARKQSSVQLRTTVTIESAALNDPSLINPLTQAPFGGKIDQVVTVALETRGLDASESAITLLRPAIEPVNGLLSKKTLKETYGLSATLAREVMTQAMKVRVSFDVRTTGVFTVNVNAHARLTSD
jgi:hypothetical protein